MIFEAKFEEQKNKRNNSEMLKTAGARLEEELRQFKQESQRVQQQPLDAKGLFINAGNQRESCRWQDEMFNRDLEVAKSQAERKTR